LTQRERKPSERHSEPTHCNHLLSGRREPVGEGMEKERERDWGRGLRMRNLEEDLAGY
jgi:hypothetical protein